jgi:hypothetical protein
MDVESLQLSVRIVQNTGPDCCQKHCGGLIEAEGWTRLLELYDVNVLQLSVEGPKLVFRLTLSLTSKLINEHLILQNSVEE